MHPSYVFPLSFHRQSPTTSVLFLALALGMFHLAFEQLNDARIVYHLMMKKAVEREKELRAAEAVLEELGGPQYSAVYCCNCGNSDRASNDQDKVDRVMELVAEMRLAVGKDGEEDEAFREGSS